MPKGWVQKRKEDYYYQKSKEENYRSRSAYKLLQAVNKYHFMRKRDIVVDLGAAPGGWLQVAREIVGPGGFVLGLDINSIKSFSEPNVHTITANITQPKTIDKTLKILPQKADVVISDAAPNISGVWEVDHARQIDLARNALQLALKTLRPSGNFFVKLFQGEMFSDFLSQLKQHFETVEIIKPKASRPESSEIYALGLHLRDITGDP